MSQPLFTCSSCSDNIPLHKPRIHCLVCSWHDLCANCYVLSEFTGSHIPQHGTMLFKKSGVRPRPPPLPARRISVVPNQSQTNPIQTNPRPTSTVPNYHSPNQQQPVGPPPSASARPGSVVYSPQVEGPPAGPPSVSLAQQNPNIPSYFPPTQQVPAGPPPSNTPPFGVFGGPPTGPPPTNTSTRPISAIYSSQVGSSPVGPPPSSVSAAQPTSTAPNYAPPTQIPPAGPPPNEPPPSVAPPRPASVVPISSPPPNQTPPIGPTPSAAPNTSPSQQIPIESLRIGSPLVGPPPFVPPTYSSAQSASPSATSQVPRRPIEAPQQVPPNPTEARTPEPAHNAPNYEARQGWKPLFNGVNPSPDGVAFLNAVFDCLDTLKVGVLAPEQYSAFCDVQGYLPEEDVWKKSNKPVFGAISEDLADYELRTAYENFSIEHTFKDRIAPPNNDMSNLVSQVLGNNHSLAASFGTSLAIPRISGGKMPMLTRKGFIDITTIEIIGVPNVGWQRVNRIARYYRLQGPWSQWGDCPREMIPEEAPAELIERIKRIGEYSRRQAAERIEASRVEHALKAQGRQNAIDLLDPPGTRYYYRY